MRCLQPGDKGFNYFLYIRGATPQCTEVCFASFLYSGFITAIVVNPLERKLAKCTSVQWVKKPGLLQKVKEEFFMINI
jgi:hypothetical protein